MAQWVKALEELSSIPRASVVKGDKWFPWVVLWPPHTHATTCKAHTQSISYFNQYRNRHRNGENKQITTKKQHQWWLQARGERKTDHTCKRTSAKLGMSLVMGFPSMHKTLARTPPPHTAGLLSHQQFHPQVLGDRGCLSCHLYYF